MQKGAGSEKKRVTVHGLVCVCVCARKTKKKAVCGDKISIDSRVLKKLHIIIPHVKTIK